jgi:Tfp pilus assembly protein PilN
MIRVNLLRDQTAHAHKVSAAPKVSVSRVGLVLLALLVVVVGGMAFWYFTVSHEIDTLSAERDRLRIENARLQELRKQITEYENMKRLRQSRIEVLEKLKESQTGPVLLLNHVIHSIPLDSNMWLTSMDQKGDRVQIIGYAQRSETIPDFMSSLAATGHFDSVDLELIEEEKEAARFSLVCVNARRKVRTE